MPRFPGLPALALALVAGLLALPALAEDPVFTWVDRNGVRHYAQTPPDGVRYEVIGVRDRAIGTETAPAGPAPTGPEAAALAQDRRACERARLALDQLDANVPLEIDADGDGTMERLSDEQRAQQRRLAEQSVRAFCGGA